jgi:hypothetical protein
MRRRDWPIATSRTPASSLWKHSTNCLRLCEKKWRCNTAKRSNRRSAGWPLALAACRCVVPRAFSDSWAISQFYAGRPSDNAMRRNRLQPASAAQASVETIEHCRPVAAMTLRSPRSQGEWDGKSFPASAGGATASRCIRLGVGRRDEMSKSPRSIDNESNAGSTIENGAAKFHHYYWPPANGGGPRLRRSGWSLPRCIER